MLCLLKAGESVAGDPTPVRLSLWTESTPYSDLERRLPEYQRAQVSLHVAVHESEHISEEFFRLYRSAQKAGVEVRPWLLLSKSHGYWINKWNIDLAEKFIGKFIDEANAHGLSVNWITLDIEPPAELMHQLEKCGRDMNLIGLVQTLRHSSKDGEIHSRVNQLRHFIEGLQKKGIRIHAVTTPLVLHDLGNQEMRIQSALGVPFQSVPWDEVSFMVYREEYIRMVGEIGGDIVYQYGKLARDYYGASAALDLGEVGSAVFPDVFVGYTHHEQLQLDLQSGLAAGINRFHVYSLEGFTSLPGESWAAWLKLPPAKVPPSDWKARVLIWFLDSMSALLPSGT